MGNTIDHKIMLHKGPIGTASNDNLDQLNLSNYYTDINNSLLFTLF